MDISNKAHVDAQAEVSKRRRALELEDVRKILASPEGRRFYWRVMSECKVFLPTWDPSAKIHYNEGKRSVGLLLLREMDEIDPEAYSKMVIESKNEASFWKAMQEKLMMKGKE